MRWQFLCFFAAVFIGCHSQPALNNANVSIYLGKNAQTLNLTGLDYDVLRQLQKDSLTQQTWQSIFPVYRMPADTSMKDFQQEQPGTYRITGNTITFEPDTAFKQKQLYFARFYGNQQGISSLRLVQSRANLRRPQYTEVVFKF